MPKFRFSSLTVFIIFFGFALIEAIREQDWAEAGVFMALGILSLWADINITSRNRK